MKNIGQSLRRSSSPPDLLAAGAGRRVKARGWPPRRRQWSGGALAAARAEAAAPRLTGREDSRHDHLRAACPTLSRACAAACHRGRPRPTPRARRRAVAPYQPTDRRRATDETYRPARGLRDAIREFDRLPRDRTAPSARDAAARRHRPRPSVFATKADPRNRPRVAMRDARGKVYDAYKLKPHADIPAGEGSADAPGVEYHATMPFRSDARLRLYRCSRAYERTTATWPPPYPLQQIHSCGLMRDNSIKYGRQRRDYARRGRAQTRQTRSNVERECVSFEVRWSFE